jgi:hypothetical protein
MRIPGMSIEVEDSKSSDYGIQIPAGVGALYERVKKLFVVQCSIVVCHFEYAFSAASIRNNCAKRSHRSQMTIEH